MLALCSTVSGKKDYMCASQSQWERNLYNDNHVKFHTSRLLGIMGMLIDHMQVFVYSKQWHIPEC